jgi:predicted transcriptional regulator of viral defense system
MSPAARHCPDWNLLYEAAAGQEGLFTTEQAAKAGYSSQLLLHYLHIGRVVRIRRRVYRLVHFPAGDHEELVALWLGFDRQGVFSHQTALALHDLSDILPSRVHLTLPAAWRRRRFRVPAGVVLHHADVAEAERSWHGAIPITSPKRTLADCANAHLSPAELLSQAFQQALARGLISREDAVDVERALAPFGGTRGSGPHPRRESTC